MYLNVLRLSILFLCVLVQNASAQECRAKNSINFNRNHLNVRLNGYVIQNMTLLAAADCARECFRLTPCLSFNMATSIGLCQLNSVNSSTNLTTNLVADNKFNYYDLSVFPDTLAGPCGKKPCLMHQICLPTNGKHTCANVECPPYKAPTNGKVNPTTAVIAGRNVTVSCRAGFHIVGDRFLTCQFGGHWRGVAPKCEDDDECNLSTSNCDVNAACTNTAGSFTCSCNSGYSGDGQTCTDDDECNLDTSNCDVKAACTNTAGSFTCSCNSGYSGDGQTCTDDDECNLGTSNCDANAACTNTAGSFTCSCDSGYSGDGQTCTDDDECNLSTFKCDANAACTNTAGSFTCSCDTGYSGDGQTCTDYDECNLGTANCDANAACTNTAGSFTCSCNSGYSGDGQTCTGWSCYSWTAEDYVLLESSSEESVCSSNGNTMSYGNTANYPGCGGCWCCKPV